MLRELWLANFSDRNVIAFASTKQHSVIRAVLRRYQPDTTKRALFRYWLEIATLFRLPGVWKKVSRDELTHTLHFNLDQWMERISGIFGEQHLLPVLVWPPEPSRKRIYVHLLDRNGEALGFAKIAFDSENNSKLQREFETLNILDRENVKAFHVPSVIKYGVFDDNHFLIVEPVPDTAKTHRASNIGFPSEAVKEYAGPIQAVSYDQVKKKDWCNRFAQTIDEGSGFMKDLRAIAAEEKIELCRIHGDMGPSNLFQVDGRLWIIDWEESRDEGPYLTDSVSFYLALNRKQVMRKPRRVMDQMMSEFSSEPYNAKPIDIMMALGFLYGANFTLASMLVTLWPKKGSPVFDFPN